MAAEIKLYVTQNCPFCVRAKSFLRSKGAAFEEVDLTGKPKELTELKNRTGWMTVPQIFINGDLIGGYTDMMDLEHAGKLDLLLKMNP